MEMIDSVLTLSQFVAGRNLYEPCSNDRDCSEGLFCHNYKQDKSSCIPCINCNRYFRLEGDTRCSKEPLDCGQCLPGYESVLFSDHTEKDSCVPSATTTSLPPPDNVEPWWKEDSFIIACVALTAILLVLIGLWLGKKYKSSILSIPERLSVNFCAQGPSLNNQRNSKIPEDFITQDQNPSLRSRNEATAPLLPSNPGEPIQQFAPTAPIIPRTEENPNYPVVGCKENENIQRSAVWRNPRYANNSPSTEQSGTSEDSVSPSGAQPPNPNGAPHPAEISDTSHPIHLNDAPHPQSYNEPHGHLPHGDQGASPLSPRSHDTRFPERRSNRTRRYVRGQDAVHIPQSSNLSVPTEPPTSPPPPYSEIFTQQDDSNIDDPRIDDPDEPDYSESNSTTQGWSTRPDSPTSSFAHESEGPDREEENGSGSSRTERTHIIRYDHCTIFHGRINKSVFSSIEADSPHHVSTRANIS